MQNKTNDEFQEKLNEAIDSMNELQKAKKELGIEIFNFSLSVVNVFFSAYLVMCLLNWFVADVVMYNFDYWHSFGIALSVGYMTKNHKFDFKEKSSTQRVKETFARLMLISFTLLIGWLVS